MTIYKGSLINSNYKSILLGLALWGVTTISNAQTDSTETSVVKVERGEITGKVENPPVASAEYFHNPRKATLMSVALPGLGQIYNKKYWKVPIIYGGFAIAGYYLSDNLKHIELYKDAFAAENDGNPDTENGTGYNSTQLIDLVDQHKKWRDLSYVALAAIYVLNIIDASVDAHLFYFEVSEDISMNIQPYYNPIGQSSAGLVLSLKL